MTTDSREQTVIDMNAALPTAHLAVQRVLDAAVAAGTPGMVAEIRDHGAVFFGAAGAADTSSGRPREPQERFRIGSTTKAFTAAVVLQLAGEGALSLDDTLEQHLPSLVAGNGYDGRTITVRQLLNHTSGIFNYGNDPQFFAKGVGRAWYEHRYDSYAPEAAGAPRPVEPALLRAG